MTMREAVHVSVLCAARELISDYKRWTTGYSARDANGKPCAVHAPEAVKWCATGAIFRQLEATDEGKEKAVDIACLFSKVTPFGRHFNLVRFNDDSAHSEVVRAFDLLIERLCAGVVEEPAHG